MNTRIFIVHGWGGYPEEGWFPWLKQELEKVGCDIFVPQLPEPQTPDKEKWISALANSVGMPDERTFFIGHSLGCQTIARYVETLSPATRIGGAIFVAGFFQRLTGLENEAESQRIADNWINAPVDFKKIYSLLPKSIAIFSDNDPWVPLDNVNDFEHKIHSEIIIEHNKGHFSGSRDGAFTLPLVLEKMIGLVNGV